MQAPFPSIATTPSMICNLAGSKRFKSMEHLCKAFRIWILCVGRLPCLIHIHSRTCFFTPPVILSSWCVFILQRLMMPSASKTPWTDFIFSNRSAPVIMNGLASCKNHPEKISNRSAISLIPHISAVFFHTARMARRITIGQLMVSFFSQLLCNCFKYGRMRRGLPCLHRLGLASSVSVKFFHPALQKLFQPPKRAIPLSNRVINLISLISLTGNYCHLAFQSTHPFLILYHLDSMSSLF